MAPLSTFGGRSPYQVVIGMRPTMPRIVFNSAPTALVSVDDYVSGLLEYLQKAYKEVYWKQDEARQGLERDLSGHVAYELAVDDLCALVQP